MSIVTLKHYGYMIRNINMYLIALNTLLMFQRSRVNAEIHKRIVPIWSETIGYYRG